MRAKTLIQELAQILDNGGECEKSEISAKIKEIFADKIKEHKITAKRIEECLPRKYKRSYRSKCELSSHLKKAENIKIQDSNMKDTVDNKDGSVLLMNYDSGHNNFSGNRENIEIDAEGPKVFERQDYETPIDNANLHRILEENNELREAVKRQTVIVMGDKISSTEIEFQIPKEKYDEIKKAMTDSKYFCCMTFDEWDYDKSSIRHFSR